MKRIISLILCMILILTALAACKPDSTPENTESTPVESNPPVDNPNEENTENNEGQAPILNLDGVSPIRYTTLGEDDSYTIAGGDKLSSFYEEPFESFLGVCKYYADSSWTLYSYTVKNGNHFATYTNGAKLAHIYWIECESELNLVTSPKGGEALPSATPEVATGSFKTTVTQLQSPEENGMGYVIQLADGSFIVIDGGNANRTNELFQTLEQLNGSDSGIVIRAWILTHGHTDHYPAFQNFAAKYASRVTLETLMISPLSTKEENKYLKETVVDDLAKFSGAKLLYVHTGMTFTFCNVNLEILYTADELWISDPTRDGSLTEATDYNNSSIVSRIYTNDYSAIFLGDASEEAALRMALYYGDYLKSDMCQVAHHGVEDFPLIAYRFIKPAILWYPCSQALYDKTNRDKEVRAALAKSKYTKEIILHEKARETREFGAGKA